MVLFGNVAIDILRTAASFRFSLSGLCISSTVTHTTIAHPPDTITPVGSASPASIGDDDSMESAIPSTPSPIDDGVSMDAANPSTPADDDSRSFMTFPPESSGTRIVFCQAGHSLFLRVD